MKIQAHTPKQDWSSIIEELYTFLKKSKKVKTQEDFCKILEISPRTMQLYTSQKRKVSKKTIQKLQINYAQEIDNIIKIKLLSSAHFHEKNNKIAQNTSIVQEPQGEYNKKPTVPFYDTSLARASTIQDWKMILNSEPTLQMYAPQLNGCTICLRYECDNMTGPKNSGICKGATVGLLKINPEEDIMPMGFEYLIITKTFILIYNLYKADNGNFICKCINEAYPPIEVSPDKIHGFYAVKGYINTKFN